MGIDEKILNKSGQLTEEEYIVMKSHTLIGASMLARLDHYRDEELARTAYQICRWHHERYDGGGYPDGLKGEEIPFVEDFLVDAHFADIVERRCGHDDLAFMRREGIALRFADEGIQQHLCQKAPTI